MFLFLLQSLTLKDDRGIFLKMAAKVLEIGRVIFASDVHWCPTSRDTFQP